MWWSGFAKTKNNMGKNTEIKFVGLPIFKQIMNLVNTFKIEGQIRNHEMDYYYKVTANIVYLV
jgi:hypothetical protein